MGRLSNKSFSLTFQNNGKMIAARNGSAVPVKNPAGSLAPRRRNSPESAPALWTIASQIPPGFFFHWESPRCGTPRLPAPSTEAPPQRWLAG